MLVEVSRLIQQYFMAIWVAVLLLLTGFVTWKWPSRQPAPWPAPSRLSRADAAALLALAILFAWCAFVMLYRADLADHDHSQLTRAITGHRPISLAIWPRSGRFFPFGNQEFELLRRLGAPAMAYFALAVIELAALCVALLLLLRKLPIAVRCGATALVLVAPTIERVFHGLIYSERNVVLLLVLLAIGIQAHDRTPSRRTAIGTLVAVHLALYYKEPVFVLVAAMAGTRLLIDWVSIERPRRSWKFLADHPLELGMLGLVLVFVALYALTMLPYRSLEYAQSYPNRGTPLGAILWYLRRDPTLLVFLVVVTTRSVGIIRRRIVPDRLWDPFAVGAIAYLAFYLTLGMQSDWYMAPVDVVGIGYVTNSAWHALAANRLRSFLPAVVATAVGLLLLMLSWYMLIWRKNAIAATAGLAEFVKGTADTSSAPLRVFIPLQTSYAVMEFGALLEYKGARVTADTAARAGEVVLYTSQEIQDGKCVAFAKVPCTQASMAPAGSLTLILANDDPALGSLLRPGVSAAAIRPFGIPPFLPALRAVNTLLGGRDVPAREDWLWAYAAMTTEKADLPPVRLPDDRPPAP